MFGSIPYLVEPSTLAAAPQCPSTATWRSGRTRACCCSMRVRAVGAGCRAAARGTAVLCSVECYSHTAGAGGCMGTADAFRLSSRPCLAASAAQTRPCPACLHPAVLTVRAHTAASHAKKGWERFTDAVISQLSSRREGVVFLLWGRYAQVGAWGGGEAGSSGLGPAVCEWVGLGREAVPQP